MRFHRDEVNNFNIASMEEKLGSRHIFPLSSMVKPNIGLARG